MINNLREGVYDSSTFVMLSMKNMKAMKKLGINKTPSLDNILHGQ
jgi:hypothetical protein